VEKTLEKLARQAYLPLSKRGGVVAARISETRGASFSFDDLGDNISGITGFFGFSLVPGREKWR
jgi:hypothetical protein